MPRASKIDISTFAQKTKAFARFESRFSKIEFFDLHRRKIRSLVAPTIFFGMNFLLVDDHSLIVQALSVLLKTKFDGAQVLTGSTAEDARTLVREHSEDTDLLILDLKLPGVQTPTSLLEELVQTNPALKILVLSGIVDQANIMRCCSWVPPASYLSRLTPICSRMPSPSCYKAASISQPSF